mmetsp:Transcript_28121/g.53227  ORF Transcript_28121/g.53227 Transcript_28121/m.53227 type:complete len:281 (+) Transcript_28121:63-905(+)
MLSFHLLSLLSVVLLPLTLYAYDETDAIRNVHIAGMSYCSTDQIESGDNNHYQSINDFEVGQVWSNSSLQFVTGYDGTENTVTLAVRGSEDIDNWLDNLDAIKTSPYDDDSSVEVHKGFWKEYTTLRDSMISYILTEAEKHSTSKLKLTGHSSGAANVMLLAYDVARGQAEGLEDFQVSDLYTFGEPRVGNTAFADAVKSLAIPHTRVVHYRDIVPHVPPHLMGFHHSPQEIWYDTEDSSHYVECSETDGEDDSCSKSEWYLTASDHCTYIDLAICSAGC